jgi:hypothetical protein
MPTRSVLRRVILTGGAAGAALLTATALILHGLVPPYLAGSGDAAILLSIPFGAALGALTGAGMAYSWARKPRIAAAVCLLGGAAVFAIVGLVGWALVGSGGPGIIRHAAALAIWFGATLLWAIILMLSGLRLLFHR